MVATVGEYMRCLREQSYPELFSDACMAALNSVWQKYADQEASEVILEIPMGEAPCTADYSICIQTPEGETDEYWLEMDYDAYAEVIPGGEIPACVFADAKRLRPDRENPAFYRTVLVQVAGERLAARITPSLKRVVSLLAGRCEMLFQIGSMRARGEAESIRVYTEDMSRKDILAFLKDLKWQGNPEMLDEFLAKWETHSRKFILSFDLFEDRISERIGINFGPRSMGFRTVGCLLEDLEQAGYLLSAKRTAIGRWLRAYPQMEPVVQNDLSHVKFTVQNGNIIAAKAYLRQSGRRIHPEAPALSHPLQMNLELTTKCPLHCPQCYVELNTGREMPLDTALYWLRNAAENGVHMVNLSGGETLCYPHLIPVIEECTRLKMQSAVALSGAGADEQKLAALIEAGVDEIYISLNGSTEEVNRRTRDGYAAAIRALTLLQKVRFAHTGVNWVMHRSNADDFTEMIALCERYDVERLVILGFKPDSAGALPDYPKAEQLREVAGIVKRYTGKLMIQAESCFSQLRALIYSGFFGNRNRGLFRGCGAGRDGISVTAEGRLTPCRHLDMEEEGSSIREYWENSETLKQLRRLDSHPEGACAECMLNRYCLPCVEVGRKLHQRLAFRMEECPLAPDIQGSASI